MSIRTECEQHLRELNTEVALFIAKGWILIRFMQEMDDTHPDFIFDYLKEYEAIKARVQVVFWAICQAVGEAKELQQAMNDYSSLVGHSFQDAFIGDHEKKIDFVREIWRMTMNINNKMKAHCQTHGLSVPEFDILGQDL